MVGSRAHGSKRSWDLGSQGGRHQHLSKETDDCNSLSLRMEGPPQDPTKAQGCIALSQAEFQGPGDPRGPSGRSLSAEGLALPVSHLCTFPNPSRWVTQLGKYPGRWFW